ncbi:MAG: ATP-binding protein [Aulosira sp. DedQUE10]|nr:ATP-binding protein [Aulosira sp. DedQUE10]
MFAGISHEINNPVDFIYGNLIYANEYTQEMLNLVHLYQEDYPNPTPRIQSELEFIDIEFIDNDLLNLLKSMNLGTRRIREIVKYMQIFSHVDEAKLAEVDIHECIDSTLTILNHRLKAQPDHPGIEIVKEYNLFQLVECYIGQINQVLMNIISNAIDALDEYNQQRSLEEIKQNPSMIKIRTMMIEDNWVAIHIADNGPGMCEEVKAKLFNPFFTTKAVGKGTGLGLSISHQIVVEKHGGSIECQSISGKGTEFAIKIPVQQ